MRKLLLILVVQMSAACAHIHQAPDERDVDAVAGSGGPVGATALDWYTRSVLTEPYDPNRPTFKAMRVNGSATINKLVFTGSGCTGTSLYQLCDDTNALNFFVNSTLHWSSPHSTGGLATQYGFSSTTASGNNGFACTTNGCRFDFGAGSLDYFDSDGTTVTAHNSFQTNGSLGQVMGSTASYANAIGVASIITADVTSAGASNLISYTLPANALVVTNRCLRIKGWGTALNNANAKTVALDFGSQTIISKILTPSIASTTWSFQATVCRSGASTQDIYAEAFNPMGTTVSSVDANTVLYQAARTAGTQTETATITIKGKTTTATTTDVTMDGLTVEFM